jgi:hypothetical protein
MLYNRSVLLFEEAKQKIYFTSFLLHQMNAFTDVVANIGSGTLSNSTTILNGPIGYIVVGLLALGLVGTVIYAVRRWF